ADRLAFDNALFSDDLAIARCQRPLLGGVTHGVAERELSAGLELVELRDSFFADGADAHRERLFSLVCEPHLARPHLEGGAEGAIGADDCRHLTRPDAG